MTASSSNSDATTAVAVAATATTGTSTTLTTEDLDTNSKNHHHHQQQHRRQQPQREKRLICVRHARSQGNEFLSKPGNQWGDATFRDDPTLIDARLTPTGMDQVQHELLPTWESDHHYQQLLHEVDLVVISPLTRTQETFQYGVLPALQRKHQQQQQQQHGNNNDKTSMPHILAHPLATERVYTASDTGRSVDELAREFPWVDWSLVRDHHQKTWWYTFDNENDADANNYQEWRPHGQGQWYAVPGEPMHVFTARMKALEDWIAARDETTILLVAHWGVIHYLTGGYSAENCEIKTLAPWQPIHQQEQEQQRQQPSITTSATATTTSVSDAKE